MSNIIIPRKGIDPKAKSGAIMGVCEIILKDADSGRVKECQIKKNMLTNGLDSATNGCPYGLNQPDFGYARTGGTAFPSMPIHEQLLGGITLYPQVLGNDPDMLFPPFTNTPTGYASIDEYTQSDGKQGAYDARSSGEVEHGYRHVYSWGSAFGNGTIASIALNPRGAHNWCKNLSTSFAPQVISDSSGSSTNSGYTVFAMNSSEHYNWAVMAACDSGFIAVLNISGTWSFAYYDIKPFNMPLMRTYQYFLENNEPLWSVPASSYSESWGFDSQGNPYNISKSGNDIVVTTFDVTDGTVDSTDTYTFSASIGSGRMCIMDGYLYAGSSSAGTIYMCNLSNQEVTSLTSANVPANANCWYANGDFVYTTSGIINSGIMLDYNAQWCGGDPRQFPVYENGVWLVTSVRNAYYPEGIGAMIKRWACMTHADLQNAVQKDVSKQMVVNYSIYQV